MVVITILVFLFCFYFIYRKEKKAVNLLSVFFAIWFIVVLFAKLRLFGLKESSARAYTIMYVGALSFIFGYYFTFAVGNIRKGRVAYKYSSSDPTTNDAELINMPAFWVLTVLAFIFEMILALRVVSLLLSGGTLRTVHRVIRLTDGTGLLKNNAERLLNTLFLLPFVTALLPLSLVCVFKKISNYKAIFVTSVVLTGLYVLTHAGRIIVVDVAVYSILLLSVFKRRINKKTKWVVRFCIIILLLFVVVITASRREITLTSDFLKNSFIREVYDYFAIPVPMMDYWLAQFDKIGFSSYGIAFVHGVLEFLCEVAEKFGMSIKWFLTVTEKISYVEKYYVYSSFNDKSYNAFVTAFFFFFLDFGWLGVVCGSLIFGVASRIVENIGMVNSIKSTALYLLYSQSIARVFIRWQFYNIEYFLAFIFLMILCKRTVRIKYSLPKYTGLIKNNA